MTSSDEFGHSLWRLHGGYPKTYVITVMQERKREELTGKAEPPQKESYSRIFRQTRIRWVIWPSSRLVNLGFGKRGLLEKGVFSEKPCCRGFWDFRDSKERQTKENLTPSFPFFGHFFPRWARNRSVAGQRRNGILIVNQGSEQMWWSFPRQASGSGLYPPSTKHYPSKRSWIPKP